MKPYKIFRFLPSRISMMYYYYHILIYIWISQRKKRINLAKIDWKKSWNGSPKIWLRTPKNHRPLLTSFRIVDVFLLHITSHPLNLTYYILRCFFNRGSSMFGNYRRCQGVHFSDTRTCDARCCRVFAGSHREKYPKETLA